MVARVTCNARHCNKHPAIGVIHIPKRFIQQNAILKV